MRNLFNALFYLTVGLVFVVGGAWISNKLIQGTDTTPLPAIPVITCLADSQSYKSLIENNGQVVKLIGSKKSMYASNGRFINSRKVITKNETEKSKVACGYLLVKAHTELYGALQSWENVYINPDNFGGHINSENQIGVGDAREFSEYIFPLNEIQYWKTRAARGRGGLSNADWASLLNVSKEVTFVIALNTEENSGFIDEISITYKCWDPTTGEENKECKLEVSDKGDIETDDVE